MSKLNEVQQRLSEIDATRFHKLVDSYLSKKYNYSIHSTGTKTGEDKPRKGTPDTLITLENSHYIFVEYTAKKTKIKDKFIDDIKKCLEVKTTGIEISKIDKIILACNSSLQSNDIEALQHACNGIECEVITNSTLSYDLCSYYPTIVKKFLGIDIDNILTSDILKQRYLSDFKTISLLKNTTKPIDEIFVNLAIIKEKKDEKSNDKTLNREDFLSSYEEIHKPKEPIEIKELISISKKSLIYGKAGIGKTTLCKYIAYKWAKEEIYQEFEYVIYISLREWKTKGLKGAIKDNYYSQDEEKITLDIKDNNSQILFLFDGYDELDSDKKKDLRDEIDKYALSHYIITTRPYGYQKSDFRVNEHFETIGFTDKNVEKYIDAFFKENKDKSKSLKAYLETNISIRHIGYIPLMLEMICSQWEQKDFSESLTMTELYTQVVEDMLEKHSKNEEVYEWENREEIKELLGKIAFEALTKQTIVFDGKLIRDTIGRDRLDFFKKSIINSGFLKSDRKDKSILGNNFEFIHLTFQEYFSALYLSTLSKEEQSEIIQDWKFYPHMQMFFAFLGGLIEDKEFLLQEIESEPKNLVGKYIFKLNTLCLEEIQYDELLASRRNVIFKEFFCNVKKVHLIAIFHLIDDDFMEIFIDESKDKKIEVYDIAKILLEKDSIKYVPLFIKYLGKQEVDISFRKNLLYLLNQNNDLIDECNYDKLIEIFLSENDDSQIKDLAYFLISLEKVSDIKVKIIKSFIEKFERIKNYSNPIDFLARYSKNNKEVKNLFLSTIRSYPYNFMLIDAYIKMKNDDNSEIIEILIMFLNEVKDNSRLRALYTIYLLKTTDDIDDVFEILVGLINDGNIDIYTRSKIASYLIFNGLNEESIKDFFFKSLYQKEFQKKINLFFMALEVNAIIYMINSKDLFCYLKENELIKVCIGFIENSNIENNSKQKIIRFLFDPPHIINQELIDVFFEIIKNKDIDERSREYLTYLLLFLSRKKHTILNNFEELLDNDKLKKYIAIAISRYSIVSRKHIDMLKTLLNDKSIDEKYRENIFKVLLKFSKSSTINNEDKLYLEDIISLLKDSEDSVLKDLYANEEERKKENLFSEKGNFTHQMFNKDNDVFIYDGRKSIKSIEFTENDIVKETILEKLSEAKKLDEKYNYSLNNNGFINYLLNSLDIVKYQDILLLIIDDSKVDIEDKYYLIKMVSKTIKKDNVWYKKFIELYWFYDEEEKCDDSFTLFKQECRIKSIIIHSLIEANEIEFFITILKIKKYKNFDFFILKDIIEHLLKQENEIEDTLFDIAKEDKEFRDNFLTLSREVKLFFKAYDRNIYPKDMEILEKIKERTLILDLPLYIKDNKLCTIENGKEIHTKKPLTKEYIELLTNHKNLL